MNKIKYGDSVAIPSTGPIDEPSDLGDRDFETVEEDLNAVNENAIRWNGILSRIDSKNENIQCNESKYEYKIKKHRIGNKTYIMSFILGWDSNKYYISFQLNNLYYTEQIYRMYIDEAGINYEKHFKVTTIDENNKIYSKYEVEINNKIEGNNWLVNNMKNLIKVITDPIPIKTDDNIILSNYIKLLNATKK